MEDDIIDDEGSCVEWCRSLTECRTVEYASLYKKCSIQKKTPLDVPPFEWNTGFSNFSLYQKMCA